LVGKHYDGNKSGTISFKIRKNDEATNFDNKLNQVKENLLKEGGFEVKSKVLNHARPK
jgi:hypothetical protein